MIKTLTRTTAFAAFGCAVLLAGPVIAAAPGPANPWAEVPTAERPPPGTPDLNGGWIMKVRPKALKTVDGKAPPLLPAAKAEYDRRQAALKADPKSDPIADCLMHGTPRILYSPYPVLIAQEKDRVNFVYEANHTFRVVSLTRKPPNPADEDPAWMGYAAGRWEGKALVIDTVGFNDKTWLDYSGLPHSDQLKVEERYVLKDANTIEGRVTITDPKTFSRPWTTAFTLVRLPNYQPTERVCVRDHQM
jgi:hypothetical protein